MKLVITASATTTIVTAHVQQNEQVTSDVLITLNCHLKHFSTVVNLTAATMLLLTSTLSVISRQNFSDIRIPCD